MDNRHRDHPTYWAFVLHRISGLALALFLPVHLNVLANGVKNTAGLDAFLAWTDNPMVKLAETGLIVLLALHLTGGLRLLAVEFLPWRDWQKSAVALTGGISLVVGLIFLLNVS